MLMFIPQSGHTEIVKLLLKNPGIDVNAEDMYRSTPLKWAIAVSYNNTSLRYIEIFENIFKIQLILAMYYIFHVNVRIVGAAN